VSQPRRPQFKQAPLRKPQNLYAVLFSQFHNKFGEYLTVFYTHADANTYSKQILFPFQTSNTTMLKEIPWIIGMHDSAPGFPISAYCFISSQSLLAYVN
jgi:hypothetical protein